MATASHAVEIPLPATEVWDFVSNMEKWATLVPGYREHEIINDRQSTWTFAGNVGVLKKTVKVQIDIIDWIEPTKITFNLIGLTDKFTGNGYFEATALEAEKTEMVGFLEVNAGGLVAPVLNPVFKAVLPKATTMLTERVANKIRLVQV